MLSWTILEHGKPLEPVAAPTPQPTGREVLLRVVRCGVCHTDLHVHDGWYDIGGGKRFHMRERGNMPPIVPGHEIVGEVVASGPDAAPLAAGRRWLVYPWLGCGACATCRGGDEHLCATPRSLGIFRPGGYADHVLVPDAKYLVDIDDLEPGLAATCACSGLTAWGALSRAAPLPGEWLAIIGAGGLGLNAVGLARARGMDRVAVVEIDEAKRRAALAAGAEIALDGAAGDIAAQVRDATGGGPRAVIDFVGAAATAALGTAVLPRGGRYVICGLFGGELTLALPFLPLRAISVIGSFTGSLAEMKALLAVMKTGRVAPLPVDARPLAAVNDALTDLRAGRVSGRIVLAQ
ncbi:MAG: alcohol dehydrogenase [Alphaproteobacteria bacterium]